MSHASVWITRDGVEVGFALYDGTSCVFRGRIFQSLDDAWEFRHKEVSRSRLNFPTEYEYNPSCDCPEKDRVRVDLRTDYGGGFTRPGTMCTTHLNVREIKFRPMDKPWDYWDDEDEDDGEDAI